MSGDDYASLFEGADAGPLFLEGIGAVLDEILCPKPPAEQDGPPWTHHFPARGGWGREFLGRCGIDPDDAADVRAAYESCRADYVLWLTGRSGEIDDEAYGILVESIKDLYGWDAFPLDWPAPYLAMMTEPLRNLIPRTERTETT